MSQVDAVREVLERYARAIGDKDAAAVITCRNECQLWVRSGHRSRRC